ncbi:MAG: 3-oxoadipate enol-lactonase [Enterovirga sp.]|nr:3-oxoadipate enol-lactonase [Enterovirga sp.]
MPIVAANGVRLRYEIEGPDGAPTIVFSNSLGTDLAMWDAQVAALRSQFRCLRYDTRGHGGSEVIDRPATMEDLAADLGGLLDGLGIGRVHLVGLSIGGMTAQTFALAHPDRLASLSLLATTAHLPPPAMWLDRAAAARAGGMASLVDATMGRWFTAAAPARVAAPMRTLREAFLRVDPRGFAACCGAIAGFDLRQRVSGIRVPTLIVAGAEDTSTPPAMSEYLQGQIAGSRLVVLSPAAHILAVEQADETTARLGSFFAQAESR